MKTEFALLIPLVAIAFAMIAMACKTSLRKFRRSQLLQRCALASNAVNGLGNVLSLTADAVTTRYALVKYGSAVTGFALATAAVRPLGVCLESVVSGETGEARGIALLGLYEKPLPMLAKEAVTTGDLLYTTSTAGQVGALSATAGTYYLVGRAISTQATAGAEVLVQHCFPTAVVVS